MFSCAELFDPKASELPKLGLGYQLRTQRIALDIAHHLIKVIFCFNWKGFVSTLIDMPIADHVVVFLPARYVENVGLSPMNEIKVSSTVLVA